MDVRFIASKKSPKRSSSSSSNNNNNNNCQRPPHLVAKHHAHIHDVPRQRVGHLP